MRSNRDALSSPEIDRLLEAGGSRHCVWLLLGTDAGLRNAEIRSVTPDHVLSSGLIYIRGKGGVERTIPLTFRLANALRLEDLDRIAQHVPPDTPYVRVGARQLQRRFRQLARRADVYLPGRCVHTLRHSYATRLVDAGVRLHVVQRLLGHASVTTTSIYLHATRLTLAQSARQLEHFDMSSSTTKATRGELPGQGYLFGRRHDSDGAPWRRVRSPP